MKMKFGFLFFGILFISCALSYANENENKVEDEIITQWQCPKCGYINTSKTFSCRNCDWPFDYDDRLKKNK